MKNRTNAACLAIVAAELFAGVSMLAAYQAWIQPAAPRNQAKVAESAAAPVAPPPPTTTPAPAPAAAPPAPVPVPVVEAPPPAPAPAPPPAAVRKPIASPGAKPKSAAQPKPALTATAPAPAPVPVPIASPQPRQLTNTAPAPAPTPNAVSLAQRGIDALNARDFATAVTLLRQARTQQPNNADLGYLLGMALESTGEVGAAIDAFRSCTSGPYESIARSHVKTLAKRLAK